MKFRTLGRATAVGMSLALIWSAVAIAAVSTDQADYSPGSVVTISGDNSNDAGYLPGETVDVAVAGPNGWSAACSGVADDNGAWSCQVTLDPDPAIAVGDYSYTAVGESSGVTESGTFTDAAQTETNVTSSLNPSLVGQSVTFTATVKSGNPATVTVTTGSVKFGTGANCTGGFTELVAATAVNSNGQVTFTTSSLPQGTTTIRACYLSADTSLLQTSFGTVAQVVNPVVASVSPSITWTANPSTANEGDTKTYTFSISDSDSSSWSFVSGYPSCGTGGSLVANSASISGPSGTFQCFFPDGPATPTVSAKVTDGTNASNELTQAVTVANVKPTPAIDDLSGNSGTACIAGNEVSLDFSWTDPATTYDTYSWYVAWGDGSHSQNTNYQTADVLYGASPVSLTHTYAAGGPYTISVTVNDSDSGNGNTASSDPFSFLYDTGSGLLQPITNTQGGALPTIFKYGSTIPVKVRVVDCDGTPVSGLLLQVSVTKIGGSTPNGTAEDGVASGNANTGNGLRYTGDPDDLYIFNMSTKAWMNDSTATYEITVYGDTIADVSAIVGLRK